MASEHNIVEVRVRWRNKVWKGIEIDRNEPPQVFKHQLFSLTGVPPDRQTILGFPGGKLKDNADWAKTGLPKNMEVILIGTPPVDGNKAKEERPVVRNDLGEDGLESAYDDSPPIYPPGLENLGNTCYMNATVQCLKAVGNLTKLLREYNGSTQALNPSEKLTAHLRDLVSRMGSRNAKSLNPITFLSVLRQANPQFAQRNQRGYPMQQDAEECWSEILSRLSSALDTENHQGEARMSEQNPVDQIFGIKTRCTDSCEESEAEDVTTREEDIRVLKCHISKTVSHLHDGIKQGLEEIIEKQSNVLARTAKWRRVSRLERIPPYLIVQFVRFVWKPLEQVKAKVFRRVSIPVNLDVYEFCADDLKKALDPRRRSLNTEADDSVTPSRAGAGTATTDATAGSANSQSVFEPNGMYELCAVLTHKGRTADSGHYVAWVKENDNTWLKYDDELVSQHNEEDVKKLSGGGDWHMAYMCLYRAKGLS